MYISYIFEFSIDSCNTLCACIWFSSFMIEESIIFAVTSSAIYTSSMDIFFIDICLKTYINLRTWIEYIFWNMILPLRSTNKYSQIFFWSSMVYVLLVREYVSQNGKILHACWCTFFRKCIKCKYLERSRTVANGTTTSDESSEIPPFPIPSLKPWRYY